MVDCEFCGRLHFDLYGEAMEEGELEELLTKQRHNPEKYCGHEGYASWTTIDGKQAVGDCPCHILTQYENLFWHFRFAISNYFTMRTKAELVKAKSNSAIATNVAVVVGG